MSRLVLIFGVLIFDACFATNCQSQLSTMANLNERMTQMLNNLYSSPLLAGCGKKPKITPPACATDATPIEQPTLTPTPICPYAQPIPCPQYSIPQYANLPNPQIIYVSAMPGSAGLSVPTIPGIPVSDSSSIPIPSTQYSPIPAPHGYTLPAAPITYATTSVPNTPQSPSTQISNAPQIYPYPKPQQPATQTEYQLSNNCPKGYVSTQPETYANPNTVNTQPQCPAKSAQPQYKIVNQPQHVSYSYPSNLQAQAPQNLPHNPYPTPTQPQPQPQTQPQNTAVTSISGPSTCQPNTAPVYPQGTQMYQQTAPVYAGQNVPTYPNQETPASYYA